MIDIRVKDLFDQLPRARINSFLREPKKEDIRVKRGVGVGQKYPGSTKIKVITESQARGKFIKDWGSKVENKLDIGEMNFCDQW